MTTLPPFVAEHIEELHALCETYCVKSLKLFGSAAKGTFDPASSDLDFVVEFFPDAPGRGFSHAYFQLSDDLQTLFGRKVDLLMRSAVKNPYMARVLELSQIVLGVSGGGFHMQGAARRDGRRD